MTIFNMGAMITKFTEIFPNELEESDKVKCIIDNQFETKTRAYLRIQLTLFMVMFVIPFFILAHTKV